jgi:hypothetical protein
MRGHGHAKMRTYIPASETAAPASLLGYSKPPVTRPVTAFRPDGLPFKERHAFVDPAREWESILVVGIGVKPIHQNGSDIPFRVGQPDRIYLVSDCGSPRGYGVRQMSTPCKQGLPRLFYRSLTSGFRQPQPVTAGACAPGRVGRCFSGSADPRIRHRTLPRVRVRNALPNHPPNAARSGCSSVRGPAPWSPRSPSIRFDHADALPLSTYDRGPS